MEKRGREEAQGLLRRRSCSDLNRACMDLSVSPGSQVGGHMAPISPPSSHDCLFMPLLKLFSEGHLDLSSLPTSNARFLF